MNKNYTFQILFTFSTSFLSNYKSNKIISRIFYTLNIREVNKKNLNIQDYMLQLFNQNLKI